MAVTVSVIMRLLLCSCNNSANDDGGEMMQSITVVTEEYSEGYPQKETFPLGAESFEAKTGKPNCADAVQKISDGFAAGNFFIS